MDKENSDDDKRRIGPTCAESGGRLHDGKRDVSLGETQTGFVGGSTGDRSFRELPCDDPEPRPVTEHASPTMYDPSVIEPRLADAWAEQGVYTLPSVDEDTYYALTMFPYPSGVLHVGHWYAMAPSDAAARFVRMRGHNVLFPMGFDAFGLNAENAAIKTGIHPSDNTEDNMVRMREQFRAMGTISIGAARWSPATLTTTAGTSGCSCACTSGASRTARAPR